eukprot:9465200-Alexandrium_andersonii.AAC.1
MSASVVCPGAQSNQLLPRRPPETHRQSRSGRLGEAPGTAARRSTDWLPRAARASASSESAGDAVTSSARVESCAGPERAPAAARPPSATGRR